MTSGALFTHWEIVNSSMAITTADSNFNIGDGQHSLRRRIVVDSLEMVYFIRAGTTTSWGTGEIIVNVPLPQGYEANLNVFCATDAQGSNGRKRWPAGRAASFINKTPKDLLQISEITVRVENNQVKGHYSTHGLEVSRANTMADVGLSDGGSGTITRGMLSVPIKPI